MENLITVVGAGPGAKDYLTLLAWEKIREADVVVGGQRLLDSLAPGVRERIVLDKRLEQQLQAIKKLRQQGKKVVVLASGDSGFFGLLPVLKKHFAAGELEVIPGISSMQAAFAAIREPWQETRFVSLHGREWQELEQFLDQPYLAILTDPVHQPGAIARYLMDRGVTQARVWVCTNLSYPNQQVRCLSLAEASRWESVDPAVVVIKRE